MMPASVAEIVACLGLASAAARRYRNTPLGYDDAFGVASLALVSTAQRYDARRGISLGAYAWPRICWACHDALGRWHPGDEMPLADIDDERDPKLRHEEHYFVAEDIAASLASASDADRTVAVLVAAGYSGREIASSLDVHESRVSQRLACLRERLRIRDNKSMRGG